MVEFATAMHAVEGDIPAAWDAQERPASSSYREVDVPLNKNIPPKAPFPTVYILQKFSMHCVVIIRVAATGGRSLQTTFAPFIASCVEAPVSTPEKRSEEEMEERMMG